VHCGNVVVLSCVADQFAEARVQLDLARVHTQFATTEKLALAMKALTAVSQMLNVVRAWRVLVTVRLLCVM
jgi:hypothetical protein